MRAVQIVAPGGPEMLQVQQVDPPFHLNMKEKEVLIEATCAGVNFIDTYHRSGLYKLPHYPAVAGREGAGVVLKAGSGCTRFKKGDRVVYYTENTGTYTEKLILNEDSYMAVVPEGVKLGAACALWAQGLTAHYLVRSSYPLRTGDTCLVHAGAGGCGNLVIQMAKLLGAKVITTIGSGAGKQEAAMQAGADHIIPYALPDFQDAVKEITKGEGVDVVYDGVGKDTYLGSAACLKPRGLLVLYGNASGAVPPIDPLQLAKWGSIYLTRPTLAHYLQRPGELDARSGEVFDWLEKGKLRPRIAKLFNMEEAKQAHEFLESRQALGKILLRTFKPVAKEAKEAK
eukprot:g55891.t1